MEMLVRILSETVTRLWLHLLIFLMLTSQQ